MGKETKISIPVVVAGRDNGDGSQTTTVHNTKEEALNWLDRTEEEIENGCFYDDGGFKEDTLELIQDENGNLRLAESLCFDTDDLG